MLRKLIGRPVIAVVMATIGLASILRGLGPFTFWGRHQVAAAADPRRAVRSGPALHSAHPALGRW
jgi:branched-chain amino acid transport system permease protein